MQAEAREAAVDFIQIYNASEEIPGLINEILIIWLITIGLNLFAVIAVKYYRDAPIAAIRFIAPVFIVGAIIMSLGYIRDVLIIEGLIKSSELRTAEGEVKNLRLDRSGKLAEVFSVNGVSFRYTDTYPPGAFHKISIHGGPLREGLYVRITYIGNNIYKIEKRL
jgi:hypothetical protein